MKALEISKCPKCGKAMIRREGRFGPFLGCSGFPQCRTIVNTSGPAARPTEPRKQLNPSKYQLAIYREVLEGSGNIVVNAGAGSGKTSTCEQIGFLLPKDKDIVYAVFNAHVRDEAQGRMPAWVVVMTTHQLGLAAIAAHLGHRPEITDTKVSGILKRILEPTWNDERWVLSPVSDIVSKLKNCVLEPTVDNIAFICERYGIEASESFERFVQLAQMALSESNRNIETIDFDDMLYLPIKLSLPVKQYDWVLGDEVQDWNSAQIQLILRSVKPTGRVIAVGDRFQSMYGFRGADINAMDNIVKALNATEMPLSISYRCPASHVAYVNQVFPEIPFEQFEKARPGTLGSVSQDRMLRDVQDGDMVLCRVNADLVAPCFELIRQGVKAVIRGRDIGKGLVSLIEKMKANTVDDLVYRLLDYRAREMDKLLRVEKTAQAQAVEDRVETILAFTDRAKSIREVILRIEEVFSDQREGVVFSTVHRAKGLEADNVYILSPWKMPHPMAKQQWEQEQERNILYVALTRAKQALFLVGTDPTIYLGEKVWNTVSDSEREESMEDEPIEGPVDEAWRTAVQALVS